jgi:hypothetical protein
MLARIARKQRGRLLLFFSRPMIMLIVTGIRLLCPELNGGPVVIAGEKGGVDPDVSSATLYVTALNGPRSTGRDVARSGEAEPHFVPVTKPEIMNVVSGFLFGL